MKILHLCLASFYIDGYGYQENVLPRINKEDGHDVRILASTETFIDNLDYGYVEPREYETEYGVSIKRLPYRTIGNHLTTIKIRAYPHLYEEIEAFSPDVMMSHGLTYWSVLDVIRYKKNHPNVKFYADTHADANNSATNWISRNVLHRVFYKYLVQKAVPHLETYFYLSQETKTFLIQNYGVPEGIMEFYPLGGIIPDAQAYRQARICRREELNVRGDELLLVHSGKLDEKKRTADLLRAFAAASELNAKLIILGSIPDEQKETAECTDFDR